AAGRRAESTSSSTPSWVAPASVTATRSTSGRLRPDMASPMVWGLAEVYARPVATAWLRLAAIRTRCDAGVLWPGVFALVGVLLGCGFTLLVASVTERWRTRRQFQRYMLDPRSSLYPRAVAPSG